MNGLLKILFFIVIVRPFVLIMLGLNIRGRQRLPLSGPAVIAANHNSHLDVLVLLSLFPLRQLTKVRPIAAADYFLHGSALTRWFVIHCIGILPLDRRGGKAMEHQFQQCLTALDHNEILILFPEGSRGSPEKMSKLKKGIYHLLKDRPLVPVIPVRMYGLGKALPKGEALFVPFNCDVVIGEPIYVDHTANSFLTRLEQHFEVLTAYLSHRHVDLDND